MSFLIVFVIIIVPSLSTVNFFRDGDFIQGCDFNPAYVIEDLPSNDENKINKLEFVQALFRHGNRITRQELAPEVYFPEYAAANLPPNGDWVIQCNISTIHTSEYVDPNRNSPLQIRKKYIQNEQWYSFSNCESEQSLYGTIPQMESTANSIKNAYIKQYSSGNKPYLFNKKDIITTKTSNIGRNVRLYSTDKTRTVDSLYWFAQYLLEIDQLKTKKDVIVDMVIHDEESDPFRPQDNGKCLDQDQWNTWQSNFASSTNNSALKLEYQTTGFGAAVVEEFEAQGGVLARGGFTFWTIGFHYCAGLNIPITYDLLVNMSKFAQEREQTWDESPNGKQKNYCYNHIMSLSAYQYLVDAINEMKQGMGPKIFAISSHGQSIRRYLWGLDIYDDRTLSPNAELTTMEVYSAARGNNDNIEYYFRWTRRGEFIPYPGCDYDNGNTQLCDLEIFMQSVNDSVSIETFPEDICAKAIDECFCDLC